MAGNQTYAGAIANNTLSSNTVDLVVLSKPAQSVKVTNLTGSAPIWFTVSHPGGDCPVPVVGGQAEYCAASVAGTSVSVRHDGQFGSVIQLISSGAPSYAVEVQSVHATS